MSYVPTTLPDFSSKTCFKNKHWEMQRISAHSLNHVLPPKAKLNSLGPLQCLGHAGAMIVSNNVFLIHRSSGNLGQDLKLAEGKRRSGS